MTQNQLCTSRYDEYCVFRINQAYFLVVYVYRRDSMLRESWHPISTGAKVDRGVLDWTHAALRVLFVRFLYFVIARGVLQQDSSQFLFSGRKS